MKSILAVGIGLALGFAVLTAGAAIKPPAQKAAPACAAIAFALIFFGSGPIGIDGMRGSKRAR